MASRADLVICCIERKEGGAYAAVRYAQKIGKPVYNFAQEPKIPFADWYIQNMPPKQI